MSSVFLNIVTEAKGKKVDGSKKHEVIEEKTKEEKSDKTENKEDVTDEVSKKDDSDDKGFEEEEMSSEPVSINGKDDEEMGNTDYSKDIENNDTGLDDEISDVEDIKDDKIENDNNDTDNDSSESEDDAPPIDENDSNDYENTDNTTDGNETDDNSNTDEEVENSDSAEEKKPNTKNEFGIKNSIIDLYDLIDNTLEKLNNSLTSDAIVNKIINISKMNFEKIQKYIFSYIRYDMDKNSYIENLTMYNKFLVTIKMNVRLLSYINNKEDNKEV